MRLIFIDELRRVVVSPGLSSVFDGHLRSIRFGFTIGPPERNFRSPLDNEHGLSLNLSNHR
ncbi:MAG: hypothetical protein D6723_10455 [Acidobacteria bacterium]|nr:MAG: hypothetical protein D6723_10455 [Acidobacteriota bacterium]